MKRIFIALGLFAALSLGGYYAYQSSQLYMVKAGFSGSYGYNLLFKSAGWVIPVAILLGVFLAASIRRNKDASTITKGRVLRHDESAFFMHWTHAISTVLLLGTGIYLGFLFFPRLGQNPQEAGFALNLHFVGVVFFLFGIAYYLTETFISGSLKEHMPEGNDLKDAITHYTAKIGFGKAPQEGKYLASEKLSYPGWIVIVGGIVITGLVKAAAHMWDLPAGLMEVTTFLHDLAALGMLAMLVIHIIMAAVLPWSWPLLGAMLTGYVSEEYVRKHHVKWYRELTGTAGQDKGSSSQGHEVTI